MAAIFPSTNVMSATSPPGSRPPRSTTGPAASDGPHAAIAVAPSAKRQLDFISASVRATPAAPAGISRPDNTSQHGQPTSVDPRPGLLRGDLHDAVLLGDVARELAAIDAARVEADQQRLLAALDA